MGLTIAFSSILYLLRIKLFWIFIIVFFLLITIDLITYWGIKKLLSNNKKFQYILKLLFWLSSIVAYYIVFWAFYMHKWNNDPYELVRIYNNSGLLITFYLAKVSFVFFQFIQIMVNLFWNTRNRTHIFQKKIQTKVILKIGIVFSILTFLLLSYGMTLGRFSFHLTKKEIYFSNLPKSFNGFKIVQISDLHLGSFPNHEKQIEKLVDLINAQSPDLIIFTGDMVNSISNEISPFIEDLKKLKAKYGKYAVLGNHDYGDYYFWNNAVDQDIDHIQLISYIKEIGFDLLLNENRTLKYETDSITIAGVENWGHKPYRRLGDLSIALRGAKKKSFVMLLSHDPVFWEENVINNKLVDITFSGHTHGIKMGLKLGDVEINPFHFPFKLTSGIYEENEEYLYVSKGIGGSLYPGRAIIRPEVSLIVLKSKLCK